MYQYKSLEDTIVAISTPTGQGSLGIIRLSGSKALSIVDQIFVSKDNAQPSQFQNFTVHYGWIAQEINSSQEIIDEVLLTVMRAPKSYTRDDVVEISCHGGTVPLTSILNLTIDLGARLAEPGEFTKRAFLNGRIDLTQAEAVLDIIQSKTEAFLKVSHHQLKGELSTELEAIREQLMNCYTEMEALINFPEDDVDPKGRDQLIRQIDSALQRVNRLLESSKHGQILKEGIKIVLCGKPNVGKSSILNVLLKHPRAIVTDIAGTTRDTIEETAQIRGIPFQLIDTAGVLEPRDLIEEEAVKRSHLYIERADLILFILDGSCPFSQDDEHLIKHIQGKNAIVLINKCDLKNKCEEKKIRNFFKNERILNVSALKRIAIDQLESAIVENIWHEQVVDTHDILVSNIRHIKALKDCAESLREGTRILAQGHSYEFISEEIKSAVNRLDAITGRNIDNDLLEKIFSEFCIGK